MRLEKVKHLLLVRNMENGIRFYREVFGFELEIEGRMWSELKWGDLILALHGGGDGSANPTDISFQVDNIVAACRIIQEQGGRIVSPPDKRPEEPIVMAVFRDPEGNECMVTQLVG